MLREFIACAVFDEVAAGDGGFVAEGVECKERGGGAAAVEALGGEVADYYEGVREGMFEENIELLIFSTPVKCLAVRMRVVGISEGEWRVR